jgi:hypothetical protein
MTNRTVSPEAAAEAKQPRKCDRPGCPNMFVPAHSRHLFCSPRCKQICQHYRHALGRR